MLSLFQNTNTRTYTAILLTGSIRSSPDQKGAIMFQVEHITKSYGKKQILNDVSFPIPEGCAIGILGINGSGKSTLLSCIAQKYAGNRDIRIGYVPQENPLYDELKPLDNLRMWTDKHKSEILQALQAPPLAQLGIQSFLDTPVRNMSGGMKKRLSLACALLDSPALLLMDEPFAALDLPAKQDAMQFIRYYLSLGNSILIASHEEAVFQFCNRVYLLKDCTLVDASKLPEGTNYINLLRN